MPFGKLVYQFATHFWLGVCIRKYAMCVCSLPLVVSIVAHTRSNWICVTVMGGWQRGSASIAGYGVQKHSFGTCGKSSWLWPFAIEAHNHAREQSMSVSHFEFGWMVAWLAVLVGWLCRQERGHQWKHITFAIAQCCNAVTTFADAACYILRTSHTLLLCWNGCMPTPATPTSAHTLTLYYGMRYGR